MKKSLLTTMLTLLIAGAVFLRAQAQENQSPQQDQEPVIKIGTDLVQIDVVVLDKNGNVVRGLTKNDFEVSENGKRQQINFFEFVDAGKGLRIAREASPEAETGKTPPISTQGPGEREVRRIFAFVVDDLTIRSADVVYIRQMLTHFVNSQMQPTDLVGIVRTVGGEDLLQQFTSDKNLLLRSIAALTPRTSAFNAFNQDESLSPILSTGGAPSSSGDSAGQASFSAPVSMAGSPVDIDSPNDESNLILRAYMTLGTANFVIDSMKQLPGRKSMILISGGIQALSPGGGAPIVNGQDSGSDRTTIGLSSIPQAISPDGGASRIWLQQLADRATRAGVAINTIDIRGLSGQTGVPSFEVTPAKSAMGGNANGGFGRVADESMIGSRNPFDTTAAHVGLRELSAATGGIAVLNRNEFDKALGEIVDASDGYYLLAYSPTDSNFKGEFRKLEIKVKGGGYRVLSRKGYLAKVEEEAAGPKTMEEQILQAIQSPLAKRDLGLDMMVLYKASAQNAGSVDVQLNIDPARISFEDADGAKKAKIDVAGFVYNRLGHRTEGFSRTLALTLTPEEMKKVSKDGIPFPTQHADLKPGSYEIRIGVRDSKTGALGTISRYVEVPDLTKGHLSASTLLLGTVPAGETKAATPTPISGSRRVTHDKELRYGVMIYNAKRKDGHAKVTTQLTVLQDGKVLFRDQPQEVVDAGKDAALIKVGQIILSRVKPGRYLLQLEITDSQADKKSRTIYRSMDFAVVE